jgi:hypothetical protein
VSPAAAEAAQVSLDLEFAAGVALLLDLAEPPGTGRRN